MKEIHYIISASRILCQNNRSNFAVFVWPTSKPVTIVTGSGYNYSGNSHIAYVIYCHLINVPILKFLLLILTTLNEWLSLPKLNLWDNSFILRYYEVNVFKWTRIKIRSRDQNRLSELTTTSPFLDKTSVWTRNKMSLDVWPKLA